MISREHRRIPTTIIAGILIFAAAKELPKLLVTGVAATVTTALALELVLALAAIGILGKGRFREYGFRLPDVADRSGVKPVKWIWIILASLGMGAIASAAIILSGAGGNPIVKQLSLPQIILFVWILSSVIEEIFTRGFIQGHLSAFEDVPINLLLFRVGLPTFASALFFGAMHVPLLFSGADVKTTVIIVLFTFTLGLLAGHLRARSGSLLPAIAVHVLANVGGVVGAIISAILIFLLTGKPPGP